MTDETVAEEETTSEIARLAARKPPYPIVLIALFQFFKAGYLLYLFIQFWKAYSAWAAAGRPESGAFLQSFLDRPIMILFPVLSIAFVVIGWGLLSLRRWSRATLLYTIIATWIGGRFGSHASLDGLFFENRLDLRHAHFRTVLCVFLLDLFVFCCLLFYPDIAKTFGDNNDKDIVL